MVALSVRAYEGVTAALAEILDSTVETLQDAAVKAATVLEEARAVGGGKAGTSDAVLTVVLKLPTPDSIVFLTTYLQHCSRSQCPPHFNESRDVTQLPTSCPRHLGCALAYTRQTTRRADSGRRRQMIRT